MYIGPDGNLAVCDLATTGPCAPGTVGADEEPATCPDLTVEIDRAECSVDVEPECECTLNVTATVTNIGTAAAGSFRVKLSTIAGDDEALVLSLAAGASKSVRFQVTCPCPDILPPWCSTFEVIADSRDVIEECDEDNNTDTAYSCCSP
jgi:subtilase family serine protease